MNAASTPTLVSNKPNIYITGNFQKFVHYSDDLEAGIIGLCLIENARILEIMNYIKIPNVFYSEINQIIFEAMVRLARRGTGVDLFSVPIEIINGGTFDVSFYEGVRWDVECMKAMYAVTGGEHVTHWCMYLIQFYIKRIQITHALNIWGYDNPLEAAKKLNDSINEALSFQAVTDWYSVGDIMIELMDRREKIKNGATFGVPTGFADLDELTGGGIETGFHVICARPAMGKTAFALSIAINIATFGYTVGIISLEMPNVQLAARILAQTSGIDFKTIFKGDKGNYQGGAESAVESNLISVQGLPLYISDTTQVNIHAIRYKATKLVHEKKAKIIFIDYLQLVDVETNKNEQRYVAVGKLSRELKVLSKELDIPIVALAQLNRESEGTDKQSKPGRISQLRESGSIEQDMDMGIVIDRPFKRGVQFNEGGESTENDAFVDVQKHRNGEEKLIGIKFDPKTMRFYCPRNEERKKQQVFEQFDNHRIPTSDRSTAPNLKPQNDLPF